MDEQIPSTPEGDKLFAQGIQFLYKEKFGPLVKMLKNAPPDKIASAYSMAVMQAFKKLEATQPMPIELAVEVGFRLLEALMTDTVQDGIVEPLNGQQFAGAIADAMIKYGRSHNIPEQEVQAALQQMKQAQPVQPTVPEQQPQQPQNQQQGLLLGGQQ